MLCFSKSFPTKARTSTHIQHIGALAARTNTNAGLIGVQTSNRRVEAAHTDNLLSVGDSSPSVYIKQVHTCRHTHTQVYTPSDWPLQTCFNLPPNKLCCVLYMCVCVCVFAEIAGVHAELIISVTDGHLSSPGVDNLLRDGGLSEQDEHQPIYCIGRN